MKNLKHLAFPMVLVCTAALHQPAASGAGHRRVQPAAAAAPEPNTPSIEHLAGALGAWVGEATVGAMRVDLRAFDSAVLVEQFGPTLLSAVNPGPQRPDATGLEKSVAQSRAAAAEWRRSMLEAGATELWIVVDFELSDEALMVVLPLGPGAKAEEIIRLCGVLPRPISRNLRSERGFVIGGRSAAKTADLPAGSAKRAGELAAALGPVARSALQVVFIPPEYVRRAATEQMISLPGPLAEYSPAALIRGCKWLSLGLSTTPGSELSVVIQGSDEASSETLRQAIERGLTAGVIAAQAEGVAGAAAIGQALNPKRKGDQLLVHLDSAALGNLTRAMAPAMGKAREAAGLAVTMSELRQLAMGCLMHANDHKDAFPDSLASLMTDRYLDAGSIIGNGKGIEGYVYRKPTSAEFKSDPSRTPLAWPVFAQWPAAGLPVAFLDGHVEMVKDRKLIEKPAQP